jgi:hypothetical protein
MLSRTVALDPLEFANAFHAPLLDGVNSNVNHTQSVAQAGHDEVGYDAVLGNPNPNPK